MSWVADKLWLIAALPLAAAAVLAITRRGHRQLAVTLSIGTMALAFVLSLFAFAATLGAHGDRITRNLDWINLGATTVKLGWVLDPLSAVMLVMVTFVGALIFIYSAGYMSHDQNFTRFFCFLSLFAAAMLGLVMSNSLLGMFMCWEVVGLASYLLIGFWFHKPSAAAAAKKAFIVTRIGDLGFFIGMVWLYAETGSLLFYDGGNGCLEASALSKLVAQSTFGGMALSTAISLLIFCGAIGKSGQVPLHVWLPDAMEGPTPVSALIHAATMVAAGVFLVARTYPLMDADPTNVAGYSTALTIVTWVGAITAVFAALVAIAQDDIKRILAYSTVSQLGYMMVGIGVGGYAVGMFHLITHAFFKALLFLGAGSVIHGMHEHQDIREMGGLRRYMPLTFATYAIGMMALAGVPLLFSGFWSKDEILFSASIWKVSREPFYLALFGALCTAFYMTRQVVYVFFGNPRLPSQKEAHESPKVMVLPLIVLAAFTILLSLVGTPFWPFFHEYLTGHRGEMGSGVITVMLISTVVVTLGLGLGWWIYARRPLTSTDPLESDIYYVLKNKFFVDELYDLSVVRFNGWSARGLRWLDDFVWQGAVMAVSYIVLGLAWINRLIDEFVVNLGFDTGCGGLRLGARALAFWQNGQVQRYLRFIGFAAAGLVAVLLWGWRK
ncbi:MAG TPA: NADH-quinone oxidoreductase subunit L [Verrucomicrobiae bacterium]|nr:NADH-quinone oxidoreductase subunit L [Verrucomicrobiae bacterium]